MLLVAGIALLVVLPDEWPIALLLIFVSGMIRIHDLRRGALRFVPWSLVIIALVMPLSAARGYLEELGHSANEVGGRERRRHVRVAVVAAPRTLGIVWHGYLRSKVVRLTVRVLSSRVPDVQHLIEGAAVGSRHYRSALRRLRRYCRVILCATGSGQYREYAAPARALLECCRPPASGGDDADAALRIRRGVENLACALASRRPGRA
jgi:hypothetical protein